MRTKAFLAIAVVAVMALAGIVFLEGTEQSDAATGDYQPTAYALGTNNMRVVLYEDKVLLIDLNSMTNLTGIVNYTVVLTPEGSDSPVYIRGLAAENGRLWIDVSGTDLDTETPIDLVTAGKKLNVILKPYDESSVLGTTDNGGERLVCKTSGADFTFNYNHSADWATIHNGYTTGFTDSEKTLDRKVTHKMDENISTTYFKDTTLYQWSLVGWSNAQGSDSDRSYIIEPATTMKVEEIIFAYCDALGLKTLDLSTSLTLYAKYDVAVYNMYIQNQHAAAESYVFDEATLNLNGTVSASGTQVALASVTSKVAADSFGVIRIVQDTTAGQYKYDFSADGAVKKLVGEEWVNATLYTDYKVTKLSNGMFKIYKVKADLRFIITTTDISATIATVSYDMAIDRIGQSNAAGATQTHGEVNLSFDVSDYKVVGGEKIGLDATYYRTITDTAGTTRVYGNIQNLAMTDNTNYKAYKNLENDDSILTSHKIALTTALAASYSSYDLTMILLDNYYIYAAQGFFDINGDGTFDAGEMYTPWALYKI